jgi:hypothetical protein
MISSRVPTDIGVPLKSSTLDLSSCEVKYVKNGPKWMNFESADLILLLLGLQSFLISNEFLLHK